MDTSLSAKEIAEKYLGRQVRLLRGAEVPADCLGKEPAAIIIGYTEKYSIMPCNQGEQVVVRFIDPVDSKSEWTPNNSSSAWKFVFLDVTRERGWRVNKKFIELLSEINIKPIIPASLYPHKCKYCRAPSLVQNKKTIACSNTRCRSWKHIRKEAFLAVSKIPPIIYGDSFDSPIIIRCCKANNACSISYIECGKNGLLHCKCTNLTAFECIMNKWYAFVRSEVEGTFYVSQAYYNETNGYYDWARSKDYYKLKQ